MFVYTFEVAGKGDVYTDKYYLIDDDIDNELNFTPNYLNGKSSSFL